MLSRELTSQVFIKALCMVVAALACVGLGVVLLFKYKILEF